MASPCRDPTIWNGMKQNGMEPSQVITKFSFVLLEEDGQKVWNDNLSGYALGPSSPSQFSQLKIPVLSEVM